MSVIKNMKSNIPCHSERSEESLPKGALHQVEHRDSSLRSE